MELIAFTEKGNLEEDGRAPRLVSKSVLFQDDTAQSGTVDPYDVGKHFLRGTLLVLGEDSSMLGRSTWCWQGRSSTQATSLSVGQGSLLLTFFVSLAINGSHARQMY